MAETDVSHEFRRELKGFRFGLHPTVLKCYTKGKIILTISFNVRAYFVTLYFDILLHSVKWICFPLCFDFLFPIYLHWKELFNLNMAAYSPPATPTLDTDIREDLLKHLDGEIVATQHKHDEAQKRLCERRWATQFQLDQFDNSVQDDSIFPIA